MRIALVNAPTKYVVQPCVYPPVGIGYIAASIKEDDPDIKVDVLDCAGDTDDQVLKKLFDHEWVCRYDVIGFSCSSPYWKDCERIARRIKALDLGVILIAGGSHVTITREWDTSLWDTVFIGPAIASIKMFLNDIRTTTGIARVYESAPFDYKKMPIPISPVGANINIGGSGSTAIVYTSFGCTHNCVFCAARSMYPHIKFREVSNVIEEVDHYMLRGVRNFRFMDDAFSMNEPRVIEIARKLGERGVRWGCMVRVDQVSSELLYALKSGGCDELAFGIESFDQRVLDAIGKKVLVARNVEALKLTKENGISTKAFIMIGTPGEHADTADINIRHLEYNKHYIDRVLLQTFMPYPGCPVWYEPERFGIILLDSDYSKYNAHQFMSDGKGGHQEVPIWSPHRIVGMSMQEQYENHRKMREYVISQTEYMKGVYVK